MEFKYCANENFEDFASGRVIFHKPEGTNFPVRLAQEIYCRCLSYLGKTDDVCLYDPCGGSGYLLTVLGFLNLNSLKSIIYSDVDSHSLEAARQNLNLLTSSGLEKRITQIEELYKQFGKVSHLEALKSAENLRCKISNIQIPDISFSLIDILSKEALKEMTFKADVVFTDIPYGSLVSWQGDEEDAVNVLLNNLAPILKPASVVAICSDKKQKIMLNKYKRLEKSRIGKRKFEILSLK